MPPTFDEAAQSPATLPQQLPWPAPLRVSGLTSVVAAHFGGSRAAGRAERGTSVRRGQRLPRDLRRRLTSKENRPTIHQKEATARCIGSPEAMSSTARPTVPVPTYIVRLQLPLSA